MHKKGNLESNLLLQQNVYKSNQHEKKDGIMDQKYSQVCALSLTSSLSKKIKNKLQTLLW